MRSTLFTRNIQIIVHILVFPCPPPSHSPSPSSSSYPPPSPSSSPAPFSSSSSSSSRWAQCSLNKLWQKGIVLFLYEFVRLKFTLNCSLFLDSMVRFILEFLKKNLAFYGSLIHLRLNSRHLFNHLSDNLDRPDISKAELYKTYMSIRITLRHLSMESDCWSVREKWKTTLHYSRFDLMNCLYMYIRSSVHALA